MSLKLFLCKLGFHKWMYYQRPINYKDNEFVKDNTHTLEVRRCVKCEKIEESVFGYTWLQSFMVKKDVLKKWYSVLF